jgi:hypothetical protein
MSGRPHSCIDKADQDINSASLRIIIQNFSIKQIQSSILDLTVHHSFCKWLIILSQYKQLSEVENQVIEQSLVVLSCLEKKEMFYRIVGLRLSKVALHNF